MNKLNPEVVANWLMNEDGFGATDDEFLETIKLMEKGVEEILKEDYTFFDWLGNVIAEIESNQRIRMTEQEIRNTLEELYAERQDLQEKLHFCLGNISDFEERLNNL